MTVKITKPALNLREELADLRKPSGIAGEALLRADSVQEQRDLIGAGRKNLLINGGFDVWQRGTSSITSNGYGSADRWKHYTAGVGGATFAQNSDGDMHITITGSGSGLARVGQLIEFPEKYHGKTVTFSAMVKSNSDQARLLCDTNTQWYTATDRHSGSGQWEKLQMTFTLEESGLTFLRFTVGLDGYQSANVSLTSADYITIKEAQLELGSVATEFEHRSYGEELALCQRYYQHNFPTGYYPANGQNISGTEAGVNGWVAFSATSVRSPYVYFPVTMRAEPTVTPYSADSSDSDGKWARYTGSAWVDVSSQSVDSTSSFFAVREIGGSGMTAGYSYLMRGMWAADAEL